MASQLQRVRLAYPSCWRCEDDQPHIVRIMQANAKPNTIECHGKAIGRVQSTGPPSLPKPQARDKPNCRAERLAATLHTANKDGQSGERERERKRA